MTRELRYARLFQMLHAPHQRLPWQMTANLGPCKIKGRFKGVYWLHAKKAVRASGFPIAFAVEAMILGDAIGESTNMEITISFACFKGTWRSKLLQVPSIHRARNLVMLRSYL